MAQDPLAPRDSGKIGLPRVAPGMNKIAPVRKRGGKGAKNDYASMMQPTPDGTEAKSKAKDDKILTRIRKRMEWCISAEADNRKAGKEDLDFLAGHQWPTDVMTQRNFDKRPCLTINKLPTIVHQVTNDLRQNRPGIVVSPVGDQGDREVALMYRGLIRAIERDSHADIAYDTGATSACRNGWGYWRVLTEYDGPDSFDQVLRIGRIRNPFTVYMDPDCQDPCGSDQRFCFVTEMVPQDEYEAEFPDATPFSFLQAGIGEKKLASWVDTKAIRIAEYYEFKTEMRRLVRLSTGHTGWHDELADDVLDGIKSGSIEIDKDREAPCRKLMWYKANGLEILERRECLGMWVPVIRVIGDEIDIEGKVIFSGIIRFAKDAQRMVNYWRSLQTEKVALAPKAKFLMEEGQLEGHESEFTSANVSNNPVLSYKGTSVGGTPCPPPQRLAPEPIDAGVENSLQGAAQDMMATTGIRFDGTIHERMKDESGRALRELKQTGDMGQFHYVDNFARSLRHTGDILVDLIPKVYDTKRMLTILREDDKEEQVRIDPNAGKPMQTAVIKGPDGKNKKLKIFDPTYGKYGVTVTIGPSYATKRIEAAESLMQFMSYFPPQMLSAIADLVAKEQDWPGAEALYKRLALMVPPHLRMPEMGDLPPEAQAMIQSLTTQIQQMMVERQKMIMALKDKSADRAVKVQKINADFESRLLGIASKMDIEQMKHAADATHHIIDALSAPEPAAANGAMQ